MSVSISPAELALLGRQLLNALGEGAKREQRPAELRVLTAFRADRRQSPQQLGPGQRAQFRPQRLGRRHEQAAQLAEPGPLGRHRAFASSGQRPQRFSLASGPRPCWSRLAEHAPSGPDRVERVALAGLPLPSQPADLEYPLPLSDEEACETGAERTGAFDCEGTPAGSVPIDKTKHAGITLGVCLRGRLEHHSAASHLDDRERVRVAVRINTNHVVQLICKHPNHLQPRLGDTLRCRSGGEGRGRQNCDESRRQTGGQASDQASKRAPGRHRPLCSDKSLERHPQARSFGN